MSKFFSLLKLQVKVRFGLSMARYNFRNNRKELWKAVGLALVILLAIAQLLAIYAYIMRALHRAATALASPQLIITLAASGAGLFILIFGVFYILGVLFLAKDTEFLASLPVRQSSVFLSKFALVMIGEYPIVFFLMAPPVIIYGASEQKGVLYYVAALVIMLILPVIPLVISAILSLCLMGTVSRIRRRSLAVTVGSVILLIAFLIGENMLISRIPDEGLGTEFLVKILEREDGLVEWSGRIFPPSVWVTKALAGTGTAAFANFVYLVLLSAACFAAAWLLSSLIYHRGATAQLEAEKSAEGKKLTYKSTSPVMVFFKNEWKMIIRTPVYAINSLTGMIVGPVIMCMPLIGGSFARDPDFKALLEFMERFGSTPEFVLIASAITTVFGAFNPAISSTYSREGRSVWILKTIPVKPQTQAAGKLMAGYSISLLSAVATSLAMAFTLRMRFGVWLGSLAISAAALFPICISGILIDLAKPKLRWNNANEAIKQNLNVFLATVAALAIIAVLGVACYGMLRLQAGPGLLYAALSVILAAMSWAGLLILERTAERTYARFKG